MRHENITVQIMAGGESRRMGRDKALVTLGGKTLLERAVERWSGWGRELFLSVGGEARKPLVPPGAVPVFDRYPSFGPLGGLHGGLLACHTELLLLCAVDAPFLTPAHGEGLLEAMGRADICVYTAEGRPQPLFGLYRASCLSMAQLLLEQGEGRMMRLLDMADTVYVPTEDGRAFRNLNTPEALLEAEKSLPSEKFV